MKRTLQVLLQLRSEGALARFAVGGAIAASFYIEAVATEAMDIFAFLQLPPGGVVVLTPLYDRLKELGATVQGEHVLIHDWPVQILPAYTPLVEEAVRNAQEQSFEGLANVRMYNVAGIRFPDVEVPLGTYNGWALRKAGFAEGAEFWNTGSFVPFARTRAEREARGDPRASIEERYSSHDDYVQKVQRSCDELVKRRLLLEEDARMLVERARSRNPLDPAVPLGPLVPVLVAPGG